MWSFQKCYKNISKVFGNICRFQHDYILINNASEKPFFIFKKTNLLRFLKAIFVTKKNKYFLLEIPHSTVFTGLFIKQTIQFTTHSMLKGKRTCEQTNMAVVRLQHHVHSGTISSRDWETGVSETVVSNKFLFASSRHKFLFFFFAATFAPGK